MPAFQPVLAQLNRVILGKPDTVRLALTCLIAGGHLLLEDIPGVGKTTLAQALARSLGLAFRRVQFTSDLLPADLTGVNVFDRSSGQFRFEPGPLFSQLVLADEINRASPRTQSALLEAMEERQVSVDGVTRPLPDPFVVIATQNPGEQIGVFPLPESQRDRFLMCLRLGYPDPEAERRLLAGEAPSALLAQLLPVMDASGLAEARQAAARLYAAPALLDYLLALLHASRGAGAPGLSPRAGLAVLASARVWGWLAGREMVLPEDVQAVFPAVASHRLGEDGEARAHHLLTRIMPA